MSITQTMGDPWGTARKQSDKVAYLEAGLMQLVSDYEDAQAGFRFWGFVSLVFLGLGIWRYKVHKSTGKGNILRETLTD